MIKRKQTKSILINSEPLTFDPYVIPVTSTRTDSFFCAHPYPTKISYRSIIPFILAHTKPGEIVYDSFAGTCSTAIAASACVEPDPSILEQFRPSIGYDVQWGGRRSICVDIGVLPTFIGRTLLKSIDSRRFEEIFVRILQRIEKKWSWLYETIDENKEPAIIRHVVYSDVIKCTTCNKETKFIDLFVDFENGLFRSESECPKCKSQIIAAKAQRVTEIVYDDLLKKRRLAIKREPVRVFGKTGSRSWSRAVNSRDLNLVKKILKTPLPAHAKAIPILSAESRWGEMYRAGYHQDITHVHHFYTRRNYLALCVLYDAAKEFPKELRDHYLLLISSYNVAHSTLMSRFVFKKGNNSPVNTSGQPGTLYISGCPVEKNVFQGIKLKFKELRESTIQVSKWDPNAKILTIPAQSVPLRDNSIDYIFTDPPFGGNIQYSEINFLSEAWLNKFTNNRFETIISNFQKKDSSDYELLLTAAFRENFRILKSGKYMTVVFHSTQAKLWNTLRHAILNAGFEIVDSSILNKHQASFKQTTTEGAVKKDPIIVAHKPHYPSQSKSTGSVKSPDEFLVKHLMNMDENHEYERTFDYLFSRYIGHFLESGQDIRIDAKDFKKTLRKIANNRNGIWYLKIGTRR